METLIKQSEDFVTQYLNANLDPKFVYHNLAHTQRVAKNVEDLANESNVTDQEKSLLIIAAWFHDTGFTKKIKGHEEESVKIAFDFLKDKDVSNEQLEKIEAIILATKMIHAPKNILEGLIRDADSAHIASKNYDDYAALLKKEWELTLDKKVSTTEWLTENINFLAKHSFYSPIAGSKWQERKGKNLAKLLKQLSKFAEENDKLGHKKAELKFKKEKLNLPDRGIETMFRVALKNHITLSDIADTKANILLSVNAIIISVALSNLLPKLDNPSNGYLILPTLIFMATTVASIILSVMATRPNVTKGKFSKEDVANKKVNLLFFGNFHQMKLDEFEWAMEEMMQDRDYLYGSLKKDLYFLGLVLNRKYNLLRTTYMVFIVGLVVSVVSFAVSFAIAN
ncbi:Pycsar system effector family protein [Winogradskyella litorisediminis]|uniref:Pycsar system effector family protein n=1 Tax=Winogradskyella litorisediminis TaxID=1156618 RepID=A0ABW3N6B3_9FLAO